MRNILAALLLDRGYRNDDGDDRYWYHDSLGVRPLLVCIEWEMQRESAVLAAAVSHERAKEATNALIDLRENLYLARSAVLT